jgi:hypothetical protein
MEYTGFGLGVSVSATTSEIRKCFSTTAACAEKIHTVRLPVVFRKFADSCDFLVSKLDRVELQLTVVRTNLRNQLDNRCCFLL